MQWTNIGVYKHCTPNHCGDLPHRVNVRTVSIPHLYPQDAIRCFSLFGFLEGTHKDKARAVTEAWLLQYLYTAAEETL